MEKTVCIVILLLYGIVMLMMCCINIFPKKNNTKNNVHFYVARDKYDNVLCLYLGKPLRNIDTFHPCAEGCTVDVGEYFFNFGLNHKDFEHLKFEDEPVEVFLNLGD